MKAETITVSAFFVFPVARIALAVPQTVHTLRFPKSKLSVWIFRATQNRNGDAAKSDARISPPAHRLSAKGCPQLLGRNSLFFPVFSYFWMTPAGVHKSKCFIGHPPHTQSGLRADTPTDGRAFQGSPTKPLVCF